MPQSQAVYPSPCLLVSPSPSALKYLIEEDAVPFSLQSLGHFFRPFLSIKGAYPDAVERS